MERRLPLCTFTLGVSPWIHFLHYTLTENNLYNFFSKNMRWTFCFCLTPAKRGTKMHRTQSVPVSSQPCPHGAAVSFLWLPHFFLPNYLPSVFTCALPSAFTRKPPQGDAAETSPGHQHLSRSNGDVQLTHRVDLIVGWSVGPAIKTCFWIMAPHLLAV